MNLLDMFKSAPQPVTPAPAATPVAPQTTVIPAPTVAIDPNNPTAPVAEPITPVAGEEINKGPLEEYKALWENEPSKPGETVPAAPAPLDADTLQKAMAKTDFSKVITADQLTAISEGGEGAQAAFAAALNSVAQNVMVQSTLVNNKLTERALAQAEQTYVDSLPKLLRDQAAANHSVNTNPIFNNPAAKPIIEATRERLLEKFPTATPDEITKRTEDFIVALGESFAPAPVKQTVPGEEDWEKFLG